MLPPECTVAIKPSSNSLNLAEDVRLEAASNAERTSIPKSSMSRTTVRASFEIAKEASTLAKERNMLATRTPAPASIAI